MSPDDLSLTEARRIALAAQGFRRPRVYDLAERLVPPEHYHRQVDREESQRELLRLAARAHAVGTAGDLTDYYRMPIRDAR